MVDTTALYILTFCMSRRADKREANSSVNKPERSISPVVSQVLLQRNRQPFLQHRGLLRRPTRILSGLKELLIRYPCYRCCFCVELCFLRQSLQLPRLKPPTVIKLRPVYWKQHHWVASLEQSILGQRDGRLQRASRREQKWPAMRVAPSLRNYCKSDLVMVCAAV